MSSHRAGDEDLDIEKEAATVSGDILADAQDMYDSLYSQPSKKDQSKGSGTHFS